MAPLHSFSATAMLLIALLAIASATDYGYYGPAAPATKIEKPKPETDYKPQYPTKPDHYEVPKPKGKDHELQLPKVIGVQGVVLCKSGSNYFPIQGNLISFIY